MHMEKYILDNIFNWHQVFLYIKVFYFKQENTNIRLKDKYTKVIIIKRF